MQHHGVRCLLMGGQACVFYGAAEFSRDVDFAIHADPENLRRLKDALDHLQAEVVAVPPLAETFLRRGHAVHFRCHAPGAEGFRVDLMSAMRGVDPFPILWERRTTISVDNAEIDLLALPDLVAAKKTQRAKDWPMIQRLVEANWFHYRHEATLERIRFWLLEGRTPEVLLEVAGQFPDHTSELVASRPLLAAVLRKDEEGIGRQLEDERQAVMAEDKAYWGPLREELERLRWAVKKGRLR